MNTTTRTTGNAAWQQQCYGCLEEEMRKGIEDSLTFKLSGPAMVAMSLLSDSQEELEHGMKESARQTINRAKWVIGEYLMKRPDEPTGEAR